MVGLVKVVPIALFSLISGVLADAWGRRKLILATNIAAAAKSAYPTISTEEVVKADPEVIVLDDAAFGTSVESVARRPGWAALSAVKNGRVYPLDANLMSRPGPRVADAAMALAQLVHPELFK